MSQKPRTLGKYELQTRIARGGMGEVWKAYDTQLRRHVAIKLLHSALQHDPDFSSRFEHEAQLIAALRHPHIVQIHDFNISLPPESEQSTAYMVMDYVEGRTLADYIRTTSHKQQFPPAEEIVYIFSAISLALDYAHKQGMVHRDIKPANILLDQRTHTRRACGEPVLTDFGIARLQGTPSATVVGAVLGTPLYISPEQAFGRPGDYHSDLYSLGVILYELLTGITPFRADSTVALLMQHANSLPTPPPLINPLISPDLSSVVLKSLAKQPEDRFSSASALTIALADALQTPLPRTLTNQQRAEQTLLSTEAPDSRREDLSSYAPAATAFTPANDLLRSTPPILHSQTIPHPYQPPELAQHLDLEPTKRQRSKRRILLPLVALLVLLLGTGVGIFALNASHQQKPVVSTPVGQMEFSQSRAGGSYDQITITLSNAAALQDDHTYYAWIDSNSGENEPPHWKLVVNQGGIHTGPLHYAGHSSLRMDNSILLITDEPDPDPIVPYTALSARLFYASITTKATSFAIQRCPSDPNNTVCTQ